MNAFYPFIHEQKGKKKEQLEQIPLYIEEILPELEETNKKEENHIIIIEL